MQEIEQMHRYVDNLVKQKNYLAKALNYQGIEATSTSSLSDLVSATSACEGSKGKAPYIKFTNCKNITQADVDQINVADYEDLSNMFNGGKAGLNLSS